MQSAELICRLFAATTMQSNEAGRIFIYLLAISPFIDHATDQVMAPNDTKVAARNAAALESIESRLLHLGAEAQLLEELDSKAEDETKQTMKDQKGKDPAEKAGKTTMKVTLLSGFLGAGKTTLLKRILRLNDGLSEEKRLKMAVIVNDMGEINLDAEEIKSSRIMHEEAEMVEMQNGCICCTLRGDLLKAVKKLSDEDKFDYLVIESTGIGEPLPVAQTFVMDVDSMEEKAPDLRQGEESKSALEVATDEKKSLFYYAKLDTLVTVVDSLNIYDVMSSIETLADKDNVSGMLGNTGATADSEGDVRDKYPGGREAMEEQRQTVIAASMGMPEDHLRKALKERGLQTTGTKEELVMQLVDALEGELLNNLAAQVDDRSIAKLWLDQIEFANVIVVSKAPQFLEKHGGNQNKLREIQEMLKKLNPDARIIVPSESMYGDLDIEASLINTGLFDMDEASNSANWVRELEEEEHNPETLEYGISSTTFENNEMPFHPERLHAVLSKFGDWFMSPQARSNKMDSPTFKGIVRTKGQVWLANSHAFPVFFQTSGQHVEIHPSEHPFVVEKKGTMSDVDAKAYEWMVENGWWSDEWGDHRTRLVFIGVDLDAKDIHNELNKALLTKEESAALGGHEGWKKLKDPFYDGKLVAKNESFYAYEAKKEALERQIGKLEEKSDN